MAREFARLIILGGPDGGREILLDRLPVSLGRSAQAGITLAEQYISREHLMFAAGDDGVVVEVLSASGVRIGPKKYKKGKALVLGTGDILEIGTETEILFVDVGDETRVALAEVQATREAAAAARRASKAEASPEPSPKARPQDDSDDRGDEDDTGDTTTTVAATDAQQRSRRMRRILIGLGVYLALLAAGAMFLAAASRNRKKDAEASALPPVLTAEQIERILATPPEVSENVQEAADALDRARQRFASRHYAAGDAYRCVKQYLRYKALSGQLGLGAVDQQNYQAALHDDLLPELSALYHRAILASRQGRWHAAREDFEAVRKLVPLQSDPIHHNVQRHLRYVKSRIRHEKRPRRKRPLG